MNRQDWENQISENIPRLRRYARALTQHVVAADDLVQDCLERAWSKRSTWKSGSNLRAWLFTILHNVFVDDYHRNKRAQWVAFDEYVAEERVELDGNEALRDLKTCLASLRPEYREVVLLAGLENMSYREIAQITGVPIGTVMSRLSRGREELRQLMSGSREPRLTLVK